MNKFYVKKESDTYSDAIETFGLAAIISEILKQTNIYDFQDILIEDKGFCYQVSTSKEITNELLLSCNYFDILPYISNKKDNNTNLTFHYIDYEKEKEIRNKYHSLSSEEKENSSYLPRSDFDIIRMFANMKGYKNSFYNCRAWQNYFPSLLSFILKFYSSITLDESKFEKEINSYIKKKDIKICKVNALQDINPNKGKGANQLKADGVTPKSQSDFWLRQLVRFKGGWQTFVVRYIGTKKKDFKTYSIIPNQIYFENLKSVYKSFKPLIIGEDAIKMDILLILLFTKELIRHDIAFESRWDFIAPKDKVSGFQFAYYKNLGQRPAVMNIGILGLPNFINIHNKQEGIEWIELLDEHQQLISQIDEKKSSNISMLQKYCQFISSNEFETFFDFTYEYSTFLISAHLNSKINYKPQPLSLNKLEVLMSTQEKFQPIMQNKGFNAIAMAIRSSTIKPILHKNKKDVIFGLSHKLKIASRDNESFAEEISNFVQQYNEGIMLKDYHQKQHPKYITTEELEEFFKLLDEGHSSKLIAGLLIAFGYAKEPSKESTEV